MIHLMDAAENVVEDGELLGSAMRSNDLTYTGNDPEVNRNLNMRGKYLQYLKQNSDLNGWWELRTGSRLEPEVGSRSEEVGVRYQLNDEEVSEEEHIKVQIRKNKDHINEMKPVAQIGDTIDLNPFYKNGAKDYKAALYQWGISIAEKFIYLIRRKVLVMSVSINRALKQG